MKKLKLAIVAFLLLFVIALVVAYLYPAQTGIVVHHFTYREKSKPELRLDDTLKAGQHDASFSGFVRLNCDGLPALEEVNFVDFGDGAQASVPGCGTFHLMHHYPAQGQYVVSLQSGPGGVPVSMNPHPPSPVSSITVTVN